MFTFDLLFTIFAMVYHSLDFCDFILLCIISLFVSSYLCQVFFIKDFKIYNFYKTTMICPCFGDNFFQFYCLCPLYVDCLACYLCLLLTSEFSLNCPWHCDTLCVIFNIKFLKISVYIFSITSIYYIWKALLCCLLKEVVPMIYLCTLWPAAPIFYVERRCRCEYW